MIREGIITLDPNLIIRCGDHRYRITSHEPYNQYWTCVLCGHGTRPDGKFVECKAD